ncbi:MAG: Asp-tRNA(Asn)/Glu-tRNA(Gln) amidotransferase subunit GatA [Planctomycetota bacterium]|nr:Asp-tRNA(Asn)/Glu-tRNA(Gln) amidotransferase subunit GatA [Planctomycetota bacterium]
MSTAVEIAGRVRSGELDAVDVTQAALQRIDKRDGGIHAYLNCDAQAALTRAEQISESVQNGEDPGCLAGVPISLKDNIALEGETLTAGSRILEGYRAPYTAHVTERLLQEGAVLLGRTNLDEFAMGASTENSAWGATHNPWDTTRVPGGSSGGSAAAVAAGIVPVALGSETGGSIRQPAALCGITGFKPTYGAVSRRGLVAFGSSLDQIGPLAAHAEDAALVFDVIAGHDPKDATSFAGDRAGAMAEPATFENRRIAIPEDFVDDIVDPHVLATMSAAIAHMEEAGAITKVISRGRLKHIHLSIPVYYLIASSEAASNLARFDGVRYGPRKEGDDLLASYLATRGEGFGAEVQRRIMLGTFALSAGYAQAWYLKDLQVRRIIRDELTDLLTEFDFIAAPTSPFGAFPLGEKTADPYLMYLCDLFTAPACLAGLPSVSVPCGLAPRGPYKGLPIGLQLTGRAGEDHRVLAAARTFEAARGEPERCPLFESADA